MTAAEPFRPIDPPAIAAPGRSLAELETVVERGQQTFVEVGLALLEIRDRRLFREQGFGTFTDYCRQRWHFTPVRAVHLIQAAEIAGALTMVNAPPLQNERQARALVPLKDDPQALADAWRGVVAAAPELEDGTPRVTEAIVREAVQSAQRERREATSHAQAHAGRLADYEAGVASRGASPHPEGVPYGRIVQQDALSFLRWLAECGVTADLCVTSPPYWAKRTYVPGDPRELGQEREPDVYVESLCVVVDAIGRVLSEEGCLFLNLGDTLASQPGQYRGNPERSGLSQHAIQVNGSAPADRCLDVPDKSFCLIPERVVLRLVRERGWRLAGKVVWAKAGYQPENVHDRLTQTWEPVYVLTRARHAYFRRGAEHGDVWAIPVGRGGAARGHPAPFPEALVERAIRHACPEEGVVLDPFAGSGTVLAVAQRTGRRFLGCDLKGWGGAEEDVNAG